MRIGVLISLVLWSGAAAVRAEQPADIEAALAATARNEDASFAGFSAQRGERFYNASHGGDWSCATCHGSDPRAIGKHTVTGKAIEPLAPAANPKRFTNPAKVEKWFRRNCNDVLDRTCTAQERGDVLAWLRSLDAQAVR